MSDLRDEGDSVAGEKLVGWGRKVSRVHLVAGTAAHRTQSVYLWGGPARCRIDIPLRVK